MVRFIGSNGVCLIVVSSTLVLTMLIVAVARRILGRPPLGDEESYPDYEVVFDSQKSKDILGVQYRDMDETAAFMIADFKAKGWC